MTGKFSPPRLNKKPETSTTEVQNPHLKAHAEYKGPTNPLDIGVEEGHFVKRYVYAPDHGGSQVELMDIVELLQAIGIIMNEDVFLRLPDRLKRQFVVQDRMGVFTRYGTSDYDQKYGSKN